MSYDRQIATDAQTAMTDFRDKVSGLTGWGVVDDSITGSGYVIFSTPNSEEVGVSERHNSGGGGKFHADTFPEDGMGIKVGKGWDGNTFATASGPNERATIDRNGGKGWDSTDSVEYWVHYSSDGFYWYMRRTQGDGQDFASGAGYQIHATEYWDFHTANTTSGYAGSGTIGVTGSTTSQTFNGQELSPRYGGRGVLNPDGNYSNYIHDDLVMEFSPASNQDTGENPIATRSPNVWLRDRSGTSISASDVVQTSGGNNEYELLDYHDARVAISF